MRDLLFYAFLCGFILYTAPAFGQFQDCPIALVICSDTTFSVVPVDNGFDDFEHPNNRPGCLEVGKGATTIEDNNVWIYFAFRKDMPPNSVIEFTLDGEESDDFDFALYDADLTCDSLGDPIRCSFAPLDCIHCPKTGLGRGALDRAESGREIEDGFVESVVVQPGQGFYLLVNVFYTQSRDLIPFTMSWAGSAAPYLNCLADPVCDPITINLGQDTLLCKGNQSFQLNPGISGNKNRLPFIWSGDTAFFNRTDTLFPTLQIPQNLDKDSLVFYLSIDGQRCSVTDTLKIFLRSLESVLAITGDTGICQNESTRLLASPGFLSYRWNTMDTLPAITVNSKGPFWVDAMDVHGCIWRDSIAIRVGPEVLPKIIHPAPLCEGQSTLLQLNANFSTYKWQDGSQNPTLLVNRPGTYLVTVTDSEGCMASDSIQISTAPAANPVISGKPGFCPGELVEISVTQPFVSYEWNTGQRSPNISAGTAGTYIVTVEDTNGCSASASFTLKAHPQPVANILGKENLCPNESNHLALDRPFKEYNWSDNSKQSFLVVGQPGNYAITVVDANGCSAFDSIVITKTDLPALKIFTDTTICAGEVATLSASPGFTNYFWSSGEEGPSIMVRDSGMYSVRAVLESCETSDEAVVVVTQRSRFTLLGDTILCKGETAAMRILETFPVINWSNGLSGPTANFTTAGKHFVMAIDGNGCTYEKEFVIQLEIPDPFVIEGNTSLCPGQSGVLTISKPGLQYQWSTGASTQSIPVQDTGMYGVTVTSPSLCKDSAQVFVGYFPTPAVNIQGDSILCEDAPGSLEVDKSFRSYLWSTGSNLPTITVRNAGLVSILVHDFNNCPATDTFAIQLIPGPKAILTASNELDCNHDSVFLNSSGSTIQNSLYLWFGPGIPDSLAYSRGPQLVRLPGRYGLQLIDTLTQCVSLPSIVQLDDKRDGPPFKLKPDKELNCTNSSISIQVLDVSDPQKHLFRWSSNDSGSPLSNDTLLTLSQPGVYFLQLTDTLSGCVRKDSLTIAGDFMVPKVNITGDTLLTCFEPVARLTGAFSDAGRSNETYWKAITGRLSEANTDLSVNILFPGIYEFTVVNKINGCSNSDTITISQDRQPPVSNIGPDLVLNCEQTTTFTIDGSLSSSGPPFIYEWVTPQGALPATVSPQIFAQGPGRYILKVTDVQNGCFAHDTMVVLADTNLIRNLVLDIQNPSCPGESDGSVSVVTVMGGKAPYRFNFGGNGFTVNTFIEDLGPGNLSIEVFDSKGCYYTTQVNLDQDPPPTIKLGPDLFDQPIGKPIDLYPSYFAKSLQKISWWQNGNLICDNCPWLEILPIDDVVLFATIFDENGCMATDSIRITVKADGAHYIPNSFSPNADNINDYFTIFGNPEFFNIKKLQIYNRWGALVFEKSNFPPNDETLGWNGELNGRTLNPAVFVYRAILEYVNRKEVRVSGDIHLIR